ncbi:MAG: cupin domain-containing protein [Pseudomonadota bacterium]
MRIHADFSKRAVVRPGDVEFVPSPLPGVERMMLDRIGDEMARATTIVRYAEGSYFDPHTHGGGEEFYVLEGVFSDQHGDYPAGTYVRNPIGSSHKPFSKDGTTIFVKLHQFDEGDTEQKVIRTQDEVFRPGLVDGISVLPLHEYGDEHVALVRWEPGTRFPGHMHPGGEEILVLEGTFQDEFGDYPKGTWLRNPPGSMHNPFSEEGTLLYVKAGHLKALVEAAAA